MNSTDCGQLLFLRINPRALLAGMALLLLCTTPALAQPTFSIDGQSPSSLGSGVGFVSEGDLLAPGPVPIAAFGGLGIVPTGTGPFPAITFAELDALSFGVDSLGIGTPSGLLDIDPVDGRTMVHRWNFSVDEFAGGALGLVFAFPSVLTEGAIGAMEASADVFLTPTPAPFTPSSFPAPPFSFFPGTNVQVFDGDGTTAPPLGLIEPNPPTPSVPGGLPPSTPDPGDNLDALDIDTPTPSPLPLPAGIPVYFSMDAGFPDPIENPLGAFPGPNFGTALANGVSGADVLLAATGGGAFAPFAPAGTLGLDLFGFDTDDIDALIVSDTGPTPGVYDATSGPYSWGGGAADMVLFSLRRGSATIGALDSILGIPIEEGDILVPMGPGLVPGIFVAAEDLGLGTIRTGTATFIDSFGVTWADDLDALDVVQHKRGDINGDFVVDSTDIDALEATPAGAIPLGAPVEADLNFDFLVDPSFSPGAGLVSDVDWLVEDIFGTLYGDTNLDGMINAIDAGAMFAGWSTGASPGTTWAEGDISGDDMVNAIDAGAMFANWGLDTGPVALNAPEPTTLALAVLSLCGVSLIRVPPSKKRR